MPEHRLLTFRRKEDRATAGLASLEVRQYVKANDVPATTLKRRTGPHFA